MRPRLDSDAAAGVHDDPDPPDQNTIDTKMECPRCKAYGFSAVCALPGDFVQLHMVTAATRAAWEERRKHPSGGYSITAPPQDDTAKKEEE